jgi:predicted metal-dependent peptidase
MRDKTSAPSGQSVRREAAEELAGQRVSQARTKLVLGKDARSAFFAVLALRLQVMVRWDIDTFATDGENLFVNPDFAASLEPAEVEGVLCHEVMHCALGHHARRRDRDPRRWNVACDLAVNPLLVEAGFSLPGSRLLPGMGAYTSLPTGRSAEEYYALLPDQDAGEDQSRGEEGMGGPLGDPGGCGSVREPGAGTAAEQKMSSARWQVGVAQAEEMARQRGALPSGLDRSVATILRPAVAWEDVLREFVTRTARSDYHWSPPNRRFAYAGLYLPRLSGESLGDVVLAVDTSGSIGQELLDRFAAEAQGILDAYDVAMHVVYHDAAVQHVQTWRSTDGPLVLEPKGGGGTSHVPVFDWITEQGLEPTCVVCLTDLYTEFPDRQPPAPVLWAVTGSSRIIPPFGERVAIGPP